MMNATHDLDQNLDQKKDISGMTGKCEEDHVYWTALLPHY